jgi:hypothetical protein
LLVRENRDKEDGVRHRKDEDLRANHPVSIGSGRQIAIGNSG